MYHEKGGKTDRLLTSFRACHCTKMRGCPLVLPVKLAVRAEPHQPQGVRVRLLVDHHQVGFDVTVAKAGPLAGQRMVAVFGVTTRSVQNRTVIRKTNKISDLPNWVACESRPHLGRQIAGLSRSKPSLVAHPRAALTSKLR